MRRATNRVKRGLPAKRTSPSIDYWSIIEKLEERCLLAAPPAPSTPNLSTASDTGASNSDNITMDTTPTFTGSAQIGSTVHIFSDGFQIATGVTLLGSYS